jgi:hypothetical protein
MLHESYHVGRMQHAYSMQVYNGLRRPSLRSVETDLKREAAYNLSKMYMVAGNRQLAREVLMAHCRV